MALFHFQINSAGLSRLLYATTAGHHIRLPALLFNSLRPRGVASTYTDAVASASFFS